MKVRRVIGKIQKSDAGAGTWMVRVLPSKDIGIDRAEGVYVGPLTTQPIEETNHRLKQLDALVRADLIGAEFKRVDHKTFAKEGRVMIRAFYELWPVPWAPKDPTDPTTDPSNA